jgi:hypothetical protein
MRYDLIETEYMDQTRAESGLTATSWASLASVRPGTVAGAVSAGSRASLSADPETNLPSMTRISRVADPETKLPSMVHESRAAGPEAKLASVTHERRAAALNTDSTSSTGLPGAQEGTNSSSSIKLSSLRCVKSCFLFGILCRTCARVSIPKCSQSEICV